MAATDELRKMLDERGVEWFAPDGPRHDRRTEFGVIGGWDYCADESQWGYGIDLMAVRCVKTPEQAIEATLGRGTCRNISPKLGNDEFTCEECLARVYGSGGQWFDVNWKYHKFNYCPNCGRKVVE